MLRRLGWTSPWDNQPWHPQRRLRSAGRGNLKGKRRTTRYKNLHYGKGYLRVGGYYGRYNRNMRQESKFNDGNGNFVAVSTGGTQSTSMVLIAQGAGESQRIGRKIKVTSLSVRFSMNLGNSTAAANTSDIIRLIIVHDKQCNGTNAQWLDVFESTGWDAYRNLANVGRFNVLLDKRLSLRASISGDGTTSRSGESNRTWNFHRKLNIPVEYDAATANIADLKSNNLLFMFQSRFGLIDVFERRRIRFLG